MSANQELGSWHSSNYVAEWVGQDVLADMLTLPRQLSAALVADAGVEVRRVIDLGSGPGTYLDVFLSAFPGAAGVWVDSSEPMKAQAQERLAGFESRVEYVVGDVEKLEGLALGEADVILTSRVVHHFSPESVKQLYGGALNLLRPGGFFFNLDHYGSPEGWEPRYRRIRTQFTGTPKRTSAPHRHDVPFRPIPDHMQWLLDVGFATADQPWRTFFTALLAAQKETN